MAGKYIKKMDNIKIEQKLLDINSETHWGMVDRLYAQCERAMVCTSEQTFANNDRIMGT